MRRDTRDVTKTTGKSTFSKKLWARMFYKIWLSRAFQDGDNYFPEMWRGGAKFKGRKDANGMAQKCLVKNEALV